MIIKQIASKEMRKILTGSVTNFSITTTGIYTQVFETWKGNGLTNTLVLKCNYGLRETQLTMKVKASSVISKSSATDNTHKATVFFDIISLSDFASLDTEMRSLFRKWLIDFTEYNYTALAKKCSEE